MVDVDERSRDTYMESGQSHSRRRDAEEKGGGNMMGRRRKRIYRYVTTNDTKMLEEVVTVLSLQLSNHAVVRYGINGGDRSRETSSVIAFWCQAFVTQKISANSLPNAIIFQADSFLHLSSLAKVSIAHLLVPPDSRYPTTQHDKEKARSSRC